MTNERILIRDPDLLGETITSIQWMDVGDFVLTKGFLRSAIHFTMAQGKSLVIDEISKRDAEKMFGLIEQYIQDVKARVSEPRKEAPRQRPRARWTY